MWKWLIWRQNSENLKTQNFCRDRWVGKNDHCFRSYMIRKTSLILYELLYACVFSNKRMVKWLSWYPNSKTLWNSNSGCGRLLLSKAIIIWCHTAKQHLGRIHIMYFLFQRRFLLWFLLYLPILLVDSLTKLKSSNVQANRQWLTSQLTITFG